MSVGSSPIITVGTSHASESITGAQPPILVVLVLYQKEEFSSLSLTSFSRALDASGLKSQFRLLIYDNSPFKLVLPDSFPIPFYYIHDPANGGLIRAYTTALQLAEKGGNDWLLLLDQDTVLDVNYLKTLWFSLQEAANNLRCAVLVPKLLSKNKIISPARVLWGGRLLPVKKTFVGFLPWECMAFNSGALLRISAVRKVGGFKPIFWLDYLDHWLFNRLHREDYLVYVLNAALAHDLSVKSMKNMSIARYKNILVAEGEFYKSCKSQAENIAYHFNLLIRILKMVAIPIRHKFLMPTLDHLARHIRQRR